MMTGVSQYATAMLALFLEDIFTGYVWGFPASSCFVQTLLASLHSHLSDCLPLTQDHMPICYFTVARPVVPLC